MKRFHLFGLLTMLVASFFVACSDDDDDPIMAPVELRLSKTDLGQIPAAGGMDSIAVVANYKWTGKLVNEEDASWVALSAKDTMLYITFSRNESTESRSAKISVTASDSKGKGKTEEITFTQKGAVPVSGETVIFIDPEHITLDALNASVKKVEITLEDEALYENLKWIWTDESGVKAEKPEWMEEPVLNEHMLTLKTATENTGEEYRKAWLLLSLEGAESVILSIDQRGASQVPYLRIVGDRFQDDTLSLPQEGGDVFVTVETNLPWSEFPYLNSGEEALYLNGGWDELAAQGITYEEVPMAETKGGKELELRSRYKKFKFHTEKNNGPTKVIITGMALPYSISFWAARYVDTIPDVGYVDIPNDWVNDLGYLDYKAQIVFRIEGARAADLKMDKEYLTFMRKASSQKVNITSDMEWTYEIEDPDYNNWLSAERKGDELIVSVQERYAGYGTRQAKITIISGGTVKDIIVSQSDKEELKSYKLGELYYQNGTPVGIVYKLFDANSEGVGHHGMVFSLQQNTKAIGDPGLEFSHEWYPGASGDTVEYKGRPVAFDENDGRNNMDALKRVRDGGRRFADIYPAAAWVHKLNTEAGMLDGEMYAGVSDRWYLPAVNELGDLLIYLDCGDYRWTYAYSRETPERPHRSQESEALYVKINNLIKENGGQPIVYDTQSNWMPFKHYVTSTELQDYVVPAVWAVRFDYGMKTDATCEHDHKVGKFDIEAGTFAVRPILRF